MVGNLKRGLSKDSLARKVPSWLRPLAQGLYRKYLTAVEYHRYQHLILPNRDLKARQTDRRRCFIIANGPSIKGQDLLPLKDEVTIAVNSFHFHPEYRRIAPKYHIVVDPLHVVDAPNCIAWLRELEKLDTPTTFVFPVEGAALFEKYGLFKGKTVRFVLLSDQRCGTGNVKGDLSRPVSGVQCVSVGALLLGSFLGFEELYLLGCDHDWLAHPTVDTHFYDANPHYPDTMPDQSYELQMEKMLELWREYRQVREFALARGTRIYNATQGGFLDVFPRVTYEKVLESRAREIPALTP